MSRDTHAGTGIQGWYVVGVLLIAYVFAFLDRQILALLVEPIKQTLTLSDTEISLLQGFAFAVCNGVGGLPLGRLVDTHRRITVAAVGIAVWSVATALCGIAGGFVSLFLLRMVVGVGEASLTPSAYSLISDHVRPGRLGLALGVFSVGIHIGSGIALWLGASVIAQLALRPLHFPLIGELHPWQMVFILLGLPGLMVAAWIATLREPARHGGDVRPSLRQTLTHLAANARALGGVYLCMAFAAMASYSISAWAVSFLIRTYDWSLVNAGHAFGAVVIVFGALGVIAGGLLGDVVIARGIHNGRLRLMAIAALAGAPFAAAAPLAASPAGALMWLAPMIFFDTMVIGLGPSTLQDLVPNRMRGTATSIGVLIVNLVGLGIGPTSIALLTDFVVPGHQLRISLAWLLPCMLCASAAFGFAGLPYYRRSREALRESAA